jgi:hypothetical protein
LAEQISVIAASLASPPKRFGAQEAVEAHNEALRRSAVTIN